MSKRHFIATGILLTIIVGGLVSFRQTAEAITIPSFKDGFTAVRTQQAALGVKSYGSVSAFIVAILAVVGSLVAILALAALIYGAVLYITSMGDEGKTERAKKIILYALVGIILLGVSGMIVNVAINLIKK